MLAYADGRWLEAAEAAVPLDDAGFVAGHAVFETVRLHGGGLFRLPTHLSRLQRSAAALGIRLSPRPRLQALAREIVRRNAARDAVVRFIATAGRGGGGGALYITVTPMAPDWPATAERGWRLITATVRHPDARAAPPGVKTPGRIHGLLARLEAREAGADDALLLSTGGDVAEGPSWNVFWRRARRLRTPSAEVGVLQGVTRAILLELAPGLGLEVEQGRWPRSELEDADEVFASMTSLGVVPIRALDGRALPPVGADLAAELGRRYWRLVAREVAAGG